MSTFSSSRRRILAALSASILILTAACSSDAPVEQAAPVQVAATPAVLTNPGDEPSEGLAWFGSAGTQSGTFSATQGLEQQVLAADGTVLAEEPGNLPLKEVTLSLPLQADIATDGATYTVDYTVGVPTGTNNEQNAAIATAEGFIMSEERAADGQVSARTFQAPTSATDGARASVEAALGVMNAFPVVFPEQPVGLGATWTVDTLVNEPVAMQQHITYKLVERNGQAVTLEVSVTGNPTVRSFGNTELEILDSQVTGQGRVQLDLTKAFITRGTIDMAVELTLGDPEATTTATADPASTAEVRRIKQTTTVRGQWS